MRRGDQTAVVINFQPGNQANRRTPNAVLWLHTVPPCIRSFGFKLLNEIRCAIFLHCFDILIWFSINVIHFDDVDDWRANKENQSRAISIFCFFQIQLFYFLSTKLDLRHEWVRPDHVYRSACIAVHTAHARTPNRTSWCIESPQFFEIQRQSQTQRFLWALSFGRM